MFLVIDKHYWRIVRRSTIRQEAVDFALKASKMGGREFILAEVFGETKQVTDSIFIETKEVKVGHDPAHSGLCSGVCEQQQEDGDTLRGTPSPQHDV